MSRISYAPARDELRTVCWRRVNEKCLLWDPPPGIQAPDSRLRRPSCFWLAQRCSAAIPESSRTNADDRLSLDPLGRVEDGDGIVEGSHVADVCPQPTIPDPYHGRIIGETAHHVVQRLSPRTAVAHMKRLLEHLPHADDNVAIAYSNDHGLARDIRERVNPQELGRCVDARRRLSRLRHSAGSGRG
jgi:hypothetical protein